MVDEFAKDARLKVPMRQQLGFSSKSAKQKAAELLEDALHNDFPALKASIDKLETKWKEDHGSVSLRSRYSAGKEVLAERHHWRE